MSNIRNQHGVDLKLRDPNQVMKLARMGSAHQCRLSFMRTLLRRLKRESWQFERSLWELDDAGVGRAVYQAKGPERTYSLIAFSHDLPADSRSDRVIAEAWDATFTLFDGVPDEADLQRLAANVPKQEAGRVSCSEISLSRANRSVRLFKTIVDALSIGKQPERAALEQVGYLMRTTAVYGSGKFGAADRDLIKARSELEGPFQAEMLSVWLTRAFTVDLVEHLAAAKGGSKAAVLNPELRRCLGVGNSTGLGMAPFLVNHPDLLNNWVLARETALARVRSIAAADAAKINEFQEFVARASLNADDWYSEHPIQRPKLKALRADLAKLEAHLQDFDFTAAHAWDVLYQWGEQSLSLEGQEQLAMLMLEPHAEWVDSLAEEMAADESNLPMIDGTKSVQALRQLLQTHFSWALAEDYSKPENYSRFWYISEEKLEPRMGERFDEPGADLEQPLCIGWHIFELNQALLDWPQDASIAEFLVQNPQFRHVVRRAQQIEQKPYSEIRDNLISADILPIDMLRFKLSFFGANKFDPRSDRWVRINMFQYAPFPHELDVLPVDDWAYPPLNEASS